MKGFFSSMNFPRWVIVLMLTASGGLGYFAYAQQTRLAEVHGELARVKSVVRTIQQNAIRLDELQELASKERFRGQADAETYISSIAAMDAVKVGQVKISHSSKPMGKYEDHRYKIEPAHRDKTFHRIQISNFLYQLEAETRRLKVTSMKIEPGERLKPGELGSDNWKFETEVTSRQGSGE